MPYLVAQGALLSCNQGTSPSPLVLTPRPFASDSLLLANIHDFAPMTNIMPFAMCNSMANPQVQAATAAAMGAPTPAPCVPVTTGPWVQGSRFLEQNHGGASLPVLTTDSRCQCAWAGEITVTNANCPVKIDG